jgi:hypothetical protein
VPSLPVLQDSSWEGEAGQNAVWIFLYIFNKDENTTMYKTRTVKTVLSDATNTKTGTITHKNTTQNRLP